MDDKIVIDKNITEILSYLVKSPLIFALVIPMLLIYGATEFANAAIQAQIFFVVVSVSALIFAGWVINQFIANGIDR